MATMKSDDFESYVPDGFNNVTGANTGGPSFSGWFFSDPFKVTITTTNQHGGSKAWANRISTIQTDTPNPAGTVDAGRSFYVSCWIKKNLTAGPSLSGSNASNAVNLILMGKDSSNRLSRICGVIQPTANDSIQLLGNVAQDILDGTTTVGSGLFSTGVYHKVEMYGRLSSPSGGAGSAPNSDGCITVAIDGTIIYQNLAKKIYNMNDSTNLSSYNQTTANNYWQDVTVGWVGYLDDFLSTNDTQSCAAPPPPPVPPAGGGSATVSPVPCTPQSTTSNGGKGQSGCNTGGTGMTTSFAGTPGTIPAHSDPTDGETFTNTSAVDTWMDLYHKDTTNTINRYLRASIGIGDPNTYEGGYKSPGMAAYGDIEHSVSNEQGGHEFPSVNITYDDKVDRFIRTQLATEELEGDELYVKLASPTGRAASALPRTLFRGTIQETPVLTSSLMASISASDSIFSEYGPLGNQSKWPAKIPSRIFTTAPPDTLGMCLPWLYGEKSDEGAIDPATGKQLSKGLMPLIYAGQLPYGSAPTTVVPTSQAADDLGTVGNLGWSGGTGWKSDGTVNADHYKFVYGVDSGGAAHKIGGGRSSTASPTDTVYGFRTVWNKTATTYIYYIVFLVPPAYPAWDLFNNPVPTGSGIRYKTVDATPSNPFSDWQYICYWANPSDGLEWGAPAQADLWDVYIAAGHPMYAITGLYGSDNGGGDPNVAPSRVKINIASRPDVKVPGYTGWSQAQNYTILTDPEDNTTYWLTLIYVNPHSPLTIDHKSGKITMAINGLGVMDGSGNPIMHVEYAKHHWLENAIINKWTSGSWADNVTFPKWQDGTPKVRSSSFTTRHNYQANSTGSGLLASWYVNKQATAASFIGEWNRTESFIGYNSHGQFISFGLDEYASISSWTRIEHQYDIFGPIRRIGGVARENTVSGRSDYDPDSDKWRNAVVKLSNKDAINRYKGRVKEGDVIDFTVINNNSQMTWLLNKRKNRLGNGMVFYEVTGGLSFLNLEVGQGILLTSPIEGVGASGFTDRPMYITRKKVNLSSKPMTVTLTLWDVNDLLVESALTRGINQIAFVTDAASSVNMLVTDDATYAPAILS